MKKKEAAPGRSASAERQASEDEPKRLGSQIAALFAGLGLQAEIPEQRGDAAKPAVFEDRD